MKDKTQSTKKISATEPSTIKALQARVNTTEKHLETAWVAYEGKDEAYEIANKQQTDKLSLKALLAEAKIARLNYKIKHIEHKLAKANLKAATKSEKKSAQTAEKDIAKPKAKKANHKAPKDTAAKGKSSSEMKQPKVAKKSKKEVAVEA